MYAFMLQLFESLQSYILLDRLPSNILETRGEPYHCKFVVASLFARANEQESKGIGTTVSLTSNREA